MLELAFTSIKYMSQVGIKKFHLNKIESNSFVLILSDECNLASNIVDELKDLKDGLIINPDPTTESIAIELMNEHLKQQKQRLNTGDTTPSYLILENCSSIQNVDFWKLLGKLLRNRHILHDNIFFCGDHTTVPEAILAEVDYCFMFQETNKIKLKQLYNDFGKDIFSTYKTFLTIYEQIIDNENDTILIDYTKSKLTMNNSIFWHKVV